MFFPDTGNYDTSSIPQFWLATVCGVGLALAPAYAAKCYYMLIVDPDSFIEHREGGLRLYMPKTKIDQPDLTEDEIKEWYEAYQEMQKSRQWSDATLPASEIEMIS